MKKFMMKVRERQIINAIKENMEKENGLRFLTLNKIKSDSAKLALFGKISMDFYKNVFTTEGSEHYTKANYDYIMNY